MTILLYILKSTLAMVVLLLLYKVALEKEKMHHFNRVFLLFALVFSLCVPLLPTAYYSVVQENTNLTLQLDTVNAKTDADSPAEVGLQMTAWHWFFLVYLLGCIFFLARFGKNIWELASLTFKNQRKRFSNAELVLLDRCETPFTFMNYIFVDRSRFENDEIERQLLDHELTHARQKHSYDVLFIEFLIMIFWFNPVLRWYKNAIQLNHEFLADENVISTFKEVKKYQYLLLDTIQKNNSIYLASNINFQLTQKRLKMMTKKSSSRRKNMLIFSVLPLLMGLMLVLGNPSVTIAQSGASESKNEIQKSQESVRDSYYKDAIIHYVTKDGKTKVISYKSMDKEMKAKIPPPPPPPPVNPGEIAKLTPLSPGTVVTVKDGGKYVKVSGAMDVPPPPPPPAPPKVKEPGMTGDMPPPPPPPPAPAMGERVPKAPKAPKPPKEAKEKKKMKAKKAAKAEKKKYKEKAKMKDAPPPPPPPIDLAHFVKDGVNIYIDGKKMASQEEVDKLNLDPDNIATVDVIKEKDGSKSIRITRKNKQ